VQQHVKIPFGILIHGDRAFKGLAVHTLRKCIQEDAIAVEYLDPVIVGIGDIYRSVFGQTDILRLGKIAFPASRGTDREKYPPVLIELQQLTLLFVENPWHAVLVYSYRNRIAIREDQILAYFPVLYHIDSFFLAIYGIDEVSSPVPGNLPGKLPDLPYPADRGRRSDTQGKIAICRFVRIDKLNGLPLAVHHIHTAGTVGGYPHDLLELDLAVAQGPEVKQFLTLEVELGYIVVLDIGHIDTVSGHGKRERLCPCRDLPQIAPVLGIYLYQAAPLVNGIDIPTIIDRYIGWTLEQMLLIPCCADSLKVYAGIAENLYSVIAVIRNLHYPLIDPYPFPVADLLPAAPLCPEAVYEFPVPGEYDDLVP